MSLYKSLRLFVTVGQISGLAPFSMRHDPIRFQRNRCCEMITFFWFMVNFVVIAIILTFFNDLITAGSKSALGRALLYVMLIMNYVHTMVALAENYFKRDRNINMLNAICDLNVNFEKELEILMDFDGLKKVYRDALILWFIEIVMLVMLNVLRFREAGTAEVTNFSVFFMPTYVFGALSYFLSTTSVALVRFSVDVMAIYLNEATKNSGFIIRDDSQEPAQSDTINAKKPAVTIEKLYFIKGSFSRLWEISIAVSNLMNLAMPIGCINEFLILVFNGYWMFFYLLNNFRVPLLFYTFVATWGMSALTNLIFVANSCTQAVDKVIFFSYLKNKIKINPNF